MPGFALWMSSGTEPRRMDVPFAAALRTMAHGPADLVSSDLSAAGLRVGHVGYADYPIRTWAGERFFIGVEGEIYNKTWARSSSELRELADLWLGTGAAPDEDLRRWILDADGEYVVVMASHDGERALVFADPLGRLPLYCHLSDTEMVVARQSRFVESIVEFPALDPVGAGHFLWLGHLLGRRTLRQGVEFAPAAARFSGRIVSGAVESSLVPLYRHNCDLRDEGRDARVDPAPELVELFTAACRERVETERPRRPLLSLSGGLDSRAVAAGMARAGVPVQCATYLAAGGRGACEVPIARRLADSLDLPWQLIELDAPGAEDRELLIALKDGLNFVDMAFILDYLRRIKERWGGDTLYLTGDGGDRGLPAFRDIGCPDSLDQRTRRLGRRHAMMPREDAERLFRLEPGTLLEELGAALASYPESSLENKREHYALYDRTRRFLFEGEDRTRCFLWETSPFYSWPFFERAMRVPSVAKAGHRLYTRFLRLLSPACVEIPEPSGLRVGRPLYRLRSTAENIARNLPLPLKDLVRKIGPQPLPKAEPPAEDLARLESLLQGAWSDLVDPQAARALIHDCNCFQYACLETLLLVEE